MSKYLAFYGFIKILNFICRRFGTLCVFHIKITGVNTGCSSYLPAYEDSDLFGSKYKIIDVINTERNAGEN
jgi:hypothetical protein